MAIRILVADDHKILRAGLRGLLERNADFLVVGEAENGREARALAHNLKPHVVLMDVTMPVLNGVEATRCLRVELPEIQILAFSGRLEKSLITSMLRAGASGYVFKHRCGADELANAIRQVASGRTYFDPDSAAKILCDFQPPMEQAAGVDVGGHTLSWQEREVLQYIAEGAQLAEIAARLEVCERTVRMARDAIMERLLIFSVAGLTKFAIRHGLTSLE